VRPQTRYSITYINNLAILFFFFCSRGSFNARPLTRSDTAVTLNSWDPLAASSNERSGSFHYTDPSSLPNSPPLRRSSTVSSFNSTWDEHIISSSKDEWDDGRFSECADDLLDRRQEYGMGASSDIGDDSQSMLDGGDSDDDTRTECGDESEFQRGPDMQMHSGVDFRNASRSSSPFPSTSPPSAPPTPERYTGLITRSQRRKMETLELRQAAGNAATLDVSRTAPAHSNKYSQQDLIGCQVVWGKPPNKRRKYYVCDFCDLVIGCKYKEEMVKHVRTHPSNSYLR